VQARVYSEEEIRRNPWYPDSHYNLGLLWMRLDRLDEAVGEWEQAIAVDPDYAPPYEMLARYYQDRNPGRFEYYLGELKRLGISGLE
jgi:tetratricopeptide (TPR) repeat protein